MIWMCAPVALRAACSCAMEATNCSASRLATTTSCGEIICAGTDEARRRGNVWKDASNYNRVRTERGMRAGCQSLGRSEMCRFMLLFAAARPMPAESLESRMGQSAWGCRLCLEANAGPRAPRAAGRRRSAKGSHSCISPGCTCRSLSRGGGSLRHKARRPSKICQRSALHAKLDAPRNSLCTPGRGAARVRPGRRNATEMSHETRASPPVIGDACTWRPQGDGIAVERRSSRESLQANQSVDIPDVLVANPPDTSAGQVCATTPKCLASFQRLWLQL